MCTYLIINNVMLFCRRSSMPEPRSDAKYGLAALPLRSGALCEPLFFENVFMARL